MHLTKNSAWFYKKRFNLYFNLYINKVFKNKEQKKKMLSDCMQFQIHAFADFCIFEQEEDMCGIAAILLANANGAAAFELYDALLMLQHRGQGT